MKKYDYDVAISFASENRALVEKCADILRSLGLNVFYDDYEKSDLLGADLNEYLVNVFCNKAKYIVIFLSESYKNKYWTNYELDAIIKRYDNAKEDFILQVKLEDVSIDKLPENIGYINWISTDDTAITIAKKINPNLEFELMMEELKYYLPDYTIEFYDGNINFKCMAKSFEASYPLSLLMELYHYKLIYPLFIQASIVPN